MGSGTLITPKDFSWPQCLAEKAKVGHGVMVFQTRKAAGHSTGRLGSNGPFVV
ncbi:hypothetical protein L209DRAFT_755392 [Thermothelomyces heterothallicus CBS 203.75]